MVCPFPILLVEGCHQHLRVYDSTNFASSLASSQWGSPTHPQSPSKRFLGGPSPWGPAVHQFGWESSPSPRVYLRLNELTPRSPPALTAGLYAYKLPDCNLQHQPVGIFTHFTASESLESLSLFFSVFTEFLCFGSLPCREGGPAALFKDYGEISPRVPSL